MKKIKISLTALAILAATGCKTNDKIRMVTTIAPNGQVHREIYALENRPVQEEADMEGTDKSNELPVAEKEIYGNPFLFALTPDWEITRFDTAFKYNFWGNDSGELNVKISKDAASIEQYSKEIQCDKDKQSYAAPEESLMKKFRWFYTCYSFKTVYKKLQYESPVPIDDHLSKEEQILWTQRNMGGYNLMNGFEMYNYLDDVNRQFWAWYSLNCWEISFEIVKKLTTEYDLDTDREDLYNNGDILTEKNNEIDPEVLCSSLDIYYKTTYFSKLYQTHKELMDKDFEAAISVINHLFDEISYELVIPGKLTKTNAPLIQSDTLIWKVDGMRLLFDDYALSAEYRIANIWAFIVSGVVILIAVGSLGWRWRMRR